MRSASPPSKGAGAGRAARTHVIILDGTLSSLEPLCQTNAARLFTLIGELGSALSVYYEPGWQWASWRSVIEVTTGKGINRKIRRAYGWLASRYQPGDRIYLFGYSRGAYAVRSLAGVIDMVGLLRADQAVERHIQAAYRHYERDPQTAAARDFRRAYCHEAVGIEMIGVWDTVKSLGINAPVLWRLSERVHAFHNHDLSDIVRHGCQALAHDENREAFAPVLWQCRDDFPGRVVQVWFPGAHGDVGGQLGGYEAARPLANLSLVWMLAEAEACGLPLPEGWQARYETDPLAPARGTWRGHGRFLMTRRRRMIGQDRSERVHESVAVRAEARQAGRLADAPEV